MVSRLCPCPVQSILNPTAQEIFLEIKLNHVTPLLRILRRPRGHVTEQRARVLTVASQALDHLTSSPMTLAGSSPWCPLPREPYGQFPHLLCLCWDAASQCCFPRPPTKDDPPTHPCHHSGSLSPAQCLRITWHLPTYHGG